VLQHGGTYVEGLVVMTSQTWWRPGGKRRRDDCGVGVNWQGFALDANGLVVDPTAWMATDGDLTALQTAIYVPILSASRAEVGDLWEKLPLTISEARAGRDEALVRTVDATTAALEAISSAIVVTRKKRQR
jgi:hypothetical protein